MNDNILDRLYQIMFKIINLSQIGADIYQKGFQIGPKKTVFQLFQTFSKKKKRKNYKSHFM